MLAFPSMLLAPAEQAGIEIPKDIPDEDIEKIDKDKYPHFYIFCVMQLGRPMPEPTSHWSNAKIIKQIPTNKLKTISYLEILAMGFE